MRPKLGKTRIMTSFPPRVLEALDKLCESRGRTRAEMIQTAVELMLGDGGLLAPEPRRKPKGHKPA